MQKASVTNRMQKLQELDRTLRGAAELLDDASTQIREAGLEPTAENIRAIDVSDRR